MKGKISDRERFLHILDPIESIENFSQDISFDQYMEDLKLRNVLVHQYFGIDYKIVWNSIMENIPEFKNQIQRIVSGLN